MKPAEDTKSGEKMGYLFLSGYLMPKTRLLSVFRPFYTTASWNRIHQRTLLALRKLRESQGLTLFGVLALWAPFNRALCRGFGKAMSTDWSPIQRLVVVVRSPENATVIKDFLDRNGHDASESPK